MNAERLLALYDQVAEAPDAIARLRRFVLDLAVRGQLVAQDPADEPASELLKRIAAEKARLVKAGEIRKPKPLPPIETAPFPLPLNWRWVRIREVTSDRGQKVPDGDFTYIDVTAINKEAGVVAEPKVLTQDDAPSRARKIAATGDVLYSCVRPYLLNVAVLDQDFDPAPIASTAFAILNGHGFVLPRYLWIALRSPFMVQRVEENQRGQAYPAINDADFAVLPFPLPPLAEQRRIVAKVEELMALLDRLEAARTAREATRDRLTAASLARLTAPDTEPEAIPTHARFAIATLPALTAHADQIKPLRQTILNLAVRGKLVEQDPADDRTNQSALRPDKEAEQYDRRAFDERVDEFDLPSNWTIEPLSRVADRIVDCPHTTPKWTERGVLCIKTNQVRAGRLDLSSPTFVSEDTYKIRIDRLEPLEEDILYIREGGVLGVGCRIPPNTRLCMGQRLMLIRANTSVAPVFLELCLNSPWIADFAAAKTTGGAAPRVNMSLVRAYPVPLPPLAEQYRIVAKVDALMALCDRLEAALARADATRARLLETLLHEALAPADAANLAAA
jgi:type I restriction enzyme S subunit